MGGLLPPGAWIPIPKENLACYRYGLGYDDCLNGFITPDRLWVFDVDSDIRPTDRGPKRDCDDIPDCEQFCYECAGGPIHAESCSADGQYFCLPKEY